ncbi:regulatory protein, luxR family [Pseudonocardia thermophila]|jgi:Response regulator containing a CheY-like receiver domain and an HTH DNA-binding domain|uniref:Regulatory protein, luxR family n=1 Tax=Pseudonocardia thermophila TaxID=1848 RepID=A0A1M6UW20_PSETH|nr:helix-turn-helix transcriptional regulator [Pseudonocardia thermophila]SHK73418.1 regulatory protein, luxR family [Pseudonocardia thermophila]
MTTEAGRWTAITSHVEGGIGWITPNPHVDADARAVIRQALEAAAHHAGNPEVKTIVLSDFRPTSRPDDPLLATLYQKATALITRSAKTLVIRPTSANQVAPKQPRPCYVQPLTLRERQVMTLWMGGLSAREVGDRLFISERTVESHVSNGYRKLGINSRIELVKRAAEFGL